MRESLKLHDQELGIAYTLIFGIISLLVVKADSAQTHQGILFSTQISAYLMIILPYERMQSVTSTPFHNQVLHHMTLSFITVFSVAKSKDAIGDSRTTSQLAKLVASKSPASPQSALK